MLQQARLVVLCVLALISTGCGSTRPAVITNGTQMSDLWWAGELTDQNGNRWDVAIMPGMMPTFHNAGESWSRSAKRFAKYGDANYWRDVGELSKDCFSFAGTDCLRDFVVSGIGEDYSDTTSTIGRLVDEKPFGWIAQITWRTLWGYVIKPIGRVPLGLAGSVGGVAAGAAIVPVAGVLYPPVVGVADIAALGITVPAARIVWNQVAWTVCVLNDEPDERQNGHWGLQIIQRPPGWKSPTQHERAMQPERAPQPEGPIVIDRERMSRLISELVYLERSLAVQARRQRQITLRQKGLQRIDGGNAELQVDADARRWLETEGAAECDRLLDEIRSRDATLELPSRDAILAHLRAALGEDQTQPLAPPQSPDVPALQP